MSKFFLTTPIYYVNDKPHIGHAYTTMAADAFARFHRLRGDDVYFLTGTDENSQKNVEAMQKAGDRRLETYLARMAGAWQASWKNLDISLDDFIRTTESRHIQGVERFWRAVEQSGDIVLRDYESWYCTGCEAFKVESDLINGRCPFHPNREIDRLQEKNYFFALSRYREPLLALIDQTDFIQPPERRTEVRNYVADHLADISISREAKKLAVGISVPDDPTQRIYVWFDALLNYMTAVGYGTDEARFARYWPADVHLVGKDIIKFHCALWPAMIMSAAKQDRLLQDKGGLPLLPKQVFVHGFFTIDGQKISKSLGNAIDPKEVADAYGLDPLRYYLLREIPFGEDGDFSRARLGERYTADLGNTLGNLLNRVIAMSRKYADGAVPKVDPETCRQAEGTSQWPGADGLRTLADRVTKAYGSYRADQALALIWDHLVLANKYVQEVEPFKLVKTDKLAAWRVLYGLLEACRWHAWLLAPVMPHVADEMLRQLGVDQAGERANGWTQSLDWGRLVPGTPLPEPRVLFPRIHD